MPDGNNSQDGLQKKNKGLKGVLFSLFSGMRKKEIKNAQENEKHDGEQEKAIIEKDAKAIEAELNTRLAKDCALYMLKKRIMGEAPPEDGEEFDVSIFLAEGVEADAESRAMLAELDKKAEQVYAMWEAADTEPVDPLMFMLFNADKTKACIFVFPPMFGGEDITKEYVEAFISDKEVHFGIDEKAIIRLCENMEYMRLALIAKGDSVRHGEDGRIIERFRRENKIQLTVKWDNTIDYRDLGWLQSCVAGDVICDIIQPTKAVDGADVYGKPLKGRDGKKAAVPKGANTEINEDETALVAKIGGVVTFGGGRFRIDPMLTINGNVDISVGNLDMNGDIHIKGDVRDGFSVKATGNITISGGVEGAFITAGGNVQIGLGMNGNYTGSIVAGKDVFSKFLENTNVSAGGNVVSDTIVHSHIDSGNEIKVETGKGVIIGGSITALRKVTAVSIGNMTNRAIEIILGNTGAFLQEKKALEEACEEERGEINSLRKDIRFYERQTDTIQKRQRMNEMNLQLKMHQMKLRSLERDLKLLLTKEIDTDKCRLQAQTIFSPAQVTMGTAVKTLRKNHFNILMYYKNGEIKIANI